MKTKLTILTSLLLAAATCFAGTAAPPKDWRNLENAVSEIPSEGYCDQPYVVLRAYPRTPAWFKAM